MRTLSCPERIVVCKDSRGLASMIPEDDFLSTFVKKKNTHILESNSCNSSGQLPSINSDKQRKASIISVIRRESISLVVSAWTSLRGIVFAMIGASLYTINSTTAKYISQVNPALISLAQYAILTILAGSSVFSIDLHKSYKLLNVSQKDLLWILLRGLSSATGMFCCYTCVQLLSLANGIVITVSTPLFTFLLAHFLLNEQCGLYRMISFAITAVGIFLIGRLDLLFKSNGIIDLDTFTLLMGLTSGLAAALCHSLSLVSLRKLKNIPQETITFTCGILGLAEMATIVYSMDGYRLPKCGQEAWVLMMIGVINFVGQQMFIHSLRYEDANIVSMIATSTEVSLAFLFQITIFQKIPDNYTIIGSIMIFMVILFTSLQKYITTLPKEHRFQKWFKIIL
ncbi:solute carrier family 35 member G1-like [Brevipalpus obovatus]|uniref:solute carrier family 35 member G1-like n=1 Tax=Brevipalpus obovatus TaxID=246614 RepID=UPI003D9F74C8